MQDLGIVIIGRNEGERLRTCLQSAANRGAPVIYVDSASTDDSIAVARSLGIEVVSLDPREGLSAARARNLGFAHMQALHPTLSFVQFIDGDCELCPGWISAGRATITADPKTVLTCGVLRERNPEASPYNRLCSLEWQRVPGDVDSCLGIFLVRAAAFAEVGGFSGNVVAGEEGELCLRLRRRGGRIVQSESDMALHDAAMVRFGQWWQRARRSGLAYAQGAYLHGRGPERHCIRDCRRILFWGALLPMLALALAFPTGGWSLTLLAAYPVQFLRGISYGRRRGWSGRDARLHAFFVVIDKFPALLGLCSFHWRRLRGRAAKIIEHKVAAPPTR